MVPHESLFPAILDQFVQIHGRHCVSLDQFERYSKQTRCSKRCYEGELISGDIIHYYPTAKMST